MTFLIATSANDPDTRLPGELAMTAQDPSGAVVPNGTVQPGGFLPVPKLIVDPPLPGPLSTGSVIIAYRVENLRMLPVLSRDDRASVPGAGHLQFSVDDLPWHWAYASGEPVIVHGLPPGPHRVVLTLVDPNHKPLARIERVFTVPARRGEA
jgi:hypothetical protein